MNTAPILEWKEGDVFRWRYTAERAKQILKRSCDAYWAKSCIGVVRDGRLFDTYWVSFDSNTMRWSPAEAAAELELTYVGNFEDWEKCNESNAEYYDDSDCINLNHANSSRGNFYIRKGAKRSSARVLEVAKYKLECAESDMQSAQRKAERLRELITRVENGCDLNGVYL